MVMKQNNSIARARAHTLADPNQMKARIKKQVKQHRQYRKQQFKSEGRKGVPVLEQQEMTK